MRDHFITALNNVQVNGQRLLPRGLLAVTHRRYVCVCTHLQYRGISQTAQQRQDPLLGYLKQVPTSEDKLLDSPGPRVVNFNASKISEYDPYAVNRKYDLP